MESKKPVKDKKPLKFKKRDIVIMAILGVVIIVAIVMLILVLREYSSGEEIYNDFEKYVFLPEETAAPQQPDATNRPDNTQNDPQKDPQQSDEPAATPFIDKRAPVVDFEGLKKENPDIIAWIYSPGTPINYPVVQGETNDTYLYRTADGKNNRCGSIFLDCENERGFEDSNNVIHGHNMQNGSMFADIMKYANQEYYDEHTGIWLVTPEQTYSIEIFAGFVTSSDSDVWKLSFSDPDAFTEWKADMAKKSYFKSKVTPMAGEKVVTLSTCTYEFDGARFVVLGVLR